MRNEIKNIASLLFAIAVLLMGHGLTGTLLTLRSAAENYPDSQIGLIMSAYFLGYILGTLYCPTMINRIGHIRAFAVVAAICASLVIFQGLWVNPWNWLAIRLIYGACIVSFYLIVESWLNARTDNALRGRILAIYMVVNLLSMAAGQQLLLLGDITQLELFAIASALLSLSLVPVALTYIPQPEPVEKPVIDIRGLYRISPVGFAGCLAAGLAGGAFWTMGPLFAHQVGLNTSGTALFMSATIAGGALLQWPIGYYSDHYDRRKVLIIVAYLSAIVALFSVFIGKFPPLIMTTTMFVYGGLCFAIYPICVAQANDQSAKGESVKLSGGLLLTYGLGAIFGPLLAGLTMQFFGSYSLPLLFALCWLTLGIYVQRLVYLTGPQPSKASDQEFVPLSRTSPVAIQTLIQDTQKNIEDTKSGV